MRRTRGPNFLVAEINHNMATLNRANPPNATLIISVQKRNIDATGLLLGS